MKDVVRELHGLAPSPGQGDDPVLQPYFKPLHLEWLAKPERERAWSPTALEHARKVFAGEYVYERSQRISPSGFASECEREILFSYGGAPKIPSAPANEEKMEAGTFEHLRWQMEGLSHPFLSDVEVFHRSTELRIGGSLDGIGVDGSLFELKNTADHLFTAISTGKGTAKEYGTKMVRKHKLQMESYFLLDSLQPTPLLNGEGSLVYVNRKDPSEIYEIRIKSTPRRQAEVHAILEGLHDWIDLDQLPDMLDSCQAALGYLTRKPTDSDRRVYQGCAYREWCPTAQTVSVS